MKYAITGLIGSGKSSVSEYLRSKGYFVFDCDKYNSYLLNEDKKCFELIKDSFPSCIKDNKIDRQLLSNIIFDNKQEKEKLENILHPLILDKMLAYADTYNPFFAEVPLLFEVNWDKYFDYSLLVVCEKEISLKRLIKRGVSKKESLRRLDNQMDVSKKIERSNGIIYNNNDLAYLYDQIDRWLIENVGK